MNSDVSVHSSVQTLYHFCLFTYELCLYEKENEAHDTTVINSENVLRAQRTDWMAAGDLSRQTSDLFPTHHTNRVFINLQGPVSVHLIQF